MGSRGRDVGCFVIEATSILGRSKVKGPLESRRSPKLNGDNLSQCDDSTCAGTVGLSGMGLRGGEQETGSVRQEVVASQWLS